MISKFSAVHTRAVLWIALFLVSAGAVAQAADPFRVIPLIRDNKVLVSFDLSDGFTNEFGLSRWTMLLEALRIELGAGYATAADYADARWPATAGTAR